MFITIFLKFVGFISCFGAVVGVGMLRFTYMLVAIGSTLLW